MTRRWLALLSVLALVAGIAASALFGGSAQQTKETPKSSNANPTGLVPFVAFGDMGTGESNQLSVAAGMAAYHDKHPFDTVLMLGDNIYPDGNPALFKDKFERPYAELLKRGVRFYAALGNHDVRRGREAEMNYPNFNMNGKAYYSFVKGDALIEFFALDSTDYDRKQARWLDGALAASKAQWKVAYFHHPLYSSGITHGSDVKLRAQLEPLFVKYGVAMVLSGHDHAYERTKPQRGVQYFVSGAGGQLRKGDLDRRTSFFGVGNDTVNSFMYFEASPDKISFAAMDPAGNTLDSGVLVKSRAATSGQ
ncbi:MAG: metallophosphoesterase [Acidobacteriota bacterium]|nr:metallophosphoesterase [Acidobacteriota bacterium]